MRRSKKDSAITRETLLAAAMDVLTKTSYKAARLDDIAKAAGVTRGAIYWHFNNKQRLYHELVNESFCDSMHDLYNILDSENPSYDKIDAVAKYLLGENLPVYHKSALIYNILFAEAPEGMEETIAQVENWFKTLFEKHTKALEQGIAVGEIVEKIDPGFEARSFYNFLWGFYTNRNRFFKDYAPKIVEDYIRKTFIARIRATA
jgi:TetR/AcrR family transcriptional regulator, acrAB operon repressor